MKIYPAIAVAAACIFVLTKADGAPPTTETTVPAAAPANLPPEEQKLGFDDLMTLLVQPRHLKVFYAGTQKNWELAAAESRNLRGALSRISQSIPKYLNLGVQETTTSLFTPSLTALDAAIASADLKRFTAAYSDLTAACNACHVYLERPYIVIKVPETTAADTYPNQDFRPLP